MTYRNGKWIWQKIKQAGLTDTDREVANKNYRTCNTPSPSSGRFAMMKGSAEAAPIEGGYCYCRHHFRNKPSYGLRLHWRD